jgi:hypothetical protein
MSDVVESVVGLHLIRVDEREQPTMDEAKDEVRSLILAERTQVAESILITGIEAGANIQVVEGAADVVRRIVENPGVKLSRRALARPVVTFTGGAFTVGELITFIQSRADEFRFQIHNAPDEAIQQNLLMGLAQRKLLVERAVTEGLSASVAAREVLGQELRARLADAARELTLHPIPTRAGASVTEARQLRVEAVLQEMLREARDVLPLGSFSFILRERYSGIVYPTGVGEVVRRTTEIRGPDAPGLPPIPSGASEPLPDLNPSLPADGALPPINPGGSP